MCVCVVGGLIELKHPITILILLKIVGNYIITYMFVYLSEYLYV